MSFKTIFKGLLIAASFISTNLVAMDPDQLYQDSSCSHTTSYNTHSDGAEQAWNNSVRFILQLSFALHALKHVIYPSTADTLLEDLVSSRMYTCLCLASLNMFNKALYDAAYGPLDELTSDNYDEEKMSLLLIAGGYCVSKMFFKLANRCKKNAAELERETSELTHLALSDDTKFDIFPFEATTESKSEIFHKRALSLVGRYKNNATELAGIARTISYLAFLSANWFQFYTASRIAKDRTE